MSALQKFGSDSWTEKKLDMVSAYFEAFNTALSKQHYFTRVYIDPFAGTGYREIKDTTPDQDWLGLFEETTSEALDEESTELRKGSALRALQLSGHSFHKYVFNELDTEKLDELRKTIEKECPEKLACCEFHNEDANDFIRNYCTSTNWKSHRGVIFLDPFAAQMNWVSMEIIASTEAIDTWILFPMMAALRMLAHDISAIPTELAEKLTRFFGTPKWQTELYTVPKKSPTLFTQDSDKTETKRVNADEVGAYYIKRLNDCFAKASNNPRMLTTHRNSPLFQLHFAVGNPNGKAIGLAMKIAGHILTREK